MGSSVSLFEKWPCEKKFEPEGMLVGNLANDIIIIIILLII